MARSRDVRLASGGFRLLSLVAATLLGLGVVLGATACKSREIEAAERATAEVAAIQWNDKQDVVGKLRQLEALRGAIDRLPSTNAGEAARTKGNAALMQATRTGLVQPFMTQLERQMQTDTRDGDPGYDALKAYLLLGDRARAKAYQPWLLAEIVKRSAELLGPRAKVSPHDLRELLLGAWGPYVDALVDGGVELEPYDADAVHMAREMRRYGMLGHEYQRFVGALAHEPIDPDSPAQGTNLRYPPISLKDILAAQPVAIGVLRSKRFVSESKWQEVEGPYMANGYHAVQRGMKEYLDRESSEAWVVADDAKEEAERKRRSRQIVGRIEQDYEQQYAQQWREFLLDIEVAPAKDDKELAAHLKVLATEPCPLRQILQVLRDQTETMKGTETPTPTDPAAEPNEEIHAAFASLLAFSGPENDSGLAQYFAAIRSASDKLGQGDRSGLKAAEQKTRELLWKLDAPGQALLGPLLLAPLGAK